jgi:hypothetical protein
MNLHEYLYAGEGLQAKGAAPTIRLRGRGAKSVHLVAPQHTET